MNRYTTQIHDGDDLRYKLTAVCSVGRRPGRCVHEIVITNEDMRVELAKGPLRDLHRSPHRRFDVGAAVMGSRKRAIATVMHDHILCAQGELAGDGLAASSTGESLSSGLLPSLGRIDQVNQLTDMSLA